jgi:hypothetical protein
MEWCELTKELNFDRTNRVIPSRTRFAKQSGSLLTVNKMISTPIHNYTDIDIQIRIVGEKHSDDRIINSCNAGKDTHSTDKAISAKPITFNEANHLRFLYDSVREQYIVPNEATQFDDIHKILVKAGSWKYRFSRQIFRKMITEYEGTVPSYRRHGSSTSISWGFFILVAPVAVIIDIHIRIETGSD